MHRLAILPAVGALCLAFLWGCGSSKEVITESEPVPMDPVSPPLPGVDSLVIADVLNSFHGAFVHALAETQAAEDFLDDSRLAFALDAERPPPDSLMLFTYYARSYQAFVESRDGEGVRHALSHAKEYTTTPEQEDYARKELGWVLWDYRNFENRLAYDSLQTLFSTDPSGAQQGLAWLIPRLTQTSARMEASYNHALLAWEHDDQEGALDTLQVLWGLVADSAETQKEPYPEFVDDLRQTYATTLFERALEHRREGASALAFTYLLQVTEVGSQYTGRAFVEALRLARYNPQQARLLEPRIEKVFDAMQWEDQLAYLTLMGNLYRRTGDTEKVTVLLDRYRALRAAGSGQ